MKFKRDFLQAAFGDTKAILVTGHYGSGKTEFSVNLALEAADEDQRLALADLDIVNPYFLSREKAALYREKGIRLISSTGEALGQGLPALSAEVFAMWQDPTLYSIADIGGDPEGARVLARFNAQIMECNYKMIMVLNANRPETRTPEKALSYIQAIEEKTGLKMGGLVNNTHLCGDTDVDCVLQGAELAEATAKLANLPVICHTANKKFADDPRLAGLPIFPIDVYMKKPWEI